MKPITLEALTQALEDAQSGMDVNTTGAGYAKLVHAAMPDAPLPAAVAAERDYYRDLFNTTRQQRDGLQAQLESMQQRLTASVADVQRLREALEKVRGLSIGPTFDVAVAALAATPATGLVVVDGDVKEATDGR